jgi:hypothetical protein
MSQEADENGPKKGPNDALNAYYQQSVLGMIRDLRRRVAALEKMADSRLKRIIKLENERNSQHGK